jgi:hypothetical protein
VFCEVGAWQNIEAVEDSLTIDELFALYRTTSKRQQRLARTVAMAMGADVGPEDEDDPDVPETYKEQTVDGLGFTVPGQIMGAQDAARMPIAIGYEMQ